MHPYQVQPPELPKSWTFSITLILHKFSRPLTRICHLGIMSPGRAAD